MKKNFPVMEFLKKYPFEYCEADTYHFLVKFVLYHVPNNQHEVIELIGELNIDADLIQYFNSGTWYKQEKVGIVFVNHFHWKK